MITHRLVAGTVLRLRCESCKATFPHFLFSGEVDAGTMGLCSASSCDQNQVVLVEAEPSEWSDFEGIAVSSIESRLASELARDDLRVPRLLKVERDESSPVGVSFRDFRKAYRPPVSVYSCACCRDGESRAVSEMSVDEFGKSGGRVLATGRLVM